MANKPDWLNERSAAIPIIQDKDGIKVVLVTTKPKHKGNWIFPKGQIELGMTGPDSAAKEAFEEAGVIGQTSPTLFGTYLQNKWGCRMQVQVYTMNVTEILENWDEMQDRDRAILPLDEAINVVKSSQKHVLMKLKQALSPELQPEAQQISPGDLSHALQAGKTLTLLDVRENTERPITGILSNHEIHIPLNALENLAYSKLKDRNADIVVYCGKGIRGQAASDTLHKMGYNKVTNLQGGMEAWKAAGLRTLMPR